jgi:hypothetical protein
MARKHLYTWNNGEDKELFESLKLILGPVKNWKGQTYKRTLSFLAETKYGNSNTDIGALEMRVAFLTSKQKASYYRTRGRENVFKQVVVGAVASGVASYKDLAPRLNG